MTASPEPRAPCRRCGGGERASFPRIGSSFFGPVPLPMRAFGLSRGPRLTIRVDMRIPTETIDIVVMHSPCYQPKCYSAPSPPACYLRPQYVLPPPPAHATPAPRHASPGVLLFFSTPPPRFTDGEALLQLLWAKPLTR